MEKLTKSSLEELYINQKLSGQQISMILDESPGKIYRKLKEFSISCRELGRKAIDKATLIELYVNQRKSQREIGEILGVSHRTIGHRVKEFGLPLLQNRKPSPKQHNISKNVLEDLYLNQQLFVKEIALRLKVSENTISNRLKEFNIPLRSKSEHQALVKTRRILFKKGICRFKHSSGYVWIRQPDHPRASSNGYVSEHLLVWEKSHARSLPKGWLIHHLNGVKDDNRSENLVGIPVGKHHYGLNLEAKRRRIRELEKAVELKFGCKIEKRQQNKKSTADPRQLLLVLGTAG